MIDNPMKENQLKDKQMKEEKQLRESIRKLERVLGVLNENEMSCCGVTLAQCHAIVEIGRVGSLSLVDLANLLNLDNSTTSRTVNNLVNKGFVERRLDPEDRRYVTITLTKNGSDIFNQIERNTTEEYAKLYCRLPAEKRHQVLESLELLINAFTTCVNNF